jgi:hypothetical protein
MKRVAVCALLLFSLVTLTLHAQEDSALLDEASFWVLLEQTDIQVRSALDQHDLASASERLLPLWNTIKAIRADDAIIAIDTRWITEPLATTDEQAWITLQRRVRALLDFHAQRTASAEGAASFEALEDVLQDPRFQYIELTPTPIPTRAPQVDLQPATEAVTPGLSQVILIAAGLIAVAAFLLYFARGLNVTPVDLPVSASSDDEPTSAAQAVDVAANFAAVRDYRSAIRYLYLASLLHLDERGLIRYDSTLTNREHLRQVREQPQLYELLRSVVNVFEDVWYGYASVDEGFYQQYRQNIDRLQRLS